MARLRFETVHDLLSSFAFIREELQLEPTDDPCLPFVRSLVDRGEVNKAVGVCAYLLPRREAVWWACQSVRALRPPRSAEEHNCINAAEEWVREPQEERRFAALDLGNRSDYRSPAALVARAAGSAGSRFTVAADAWAPIQPEQTPRAVRGAILSAAAELSPQERPEALKRCVEEGVRLAANADAS